MGSLYVSANAIGTGLAELWFVRSNRFSLTTSFDDALDPLAVILFSHLSIQVPYCITYFLRIPKSCFKLLWNSS